MGAGGCVQGRNIDVQERMGTVHRREIAESSSSVRLLAGEGRGRKEVLFVRLGTGLVERDKRG